MIATLLKCSANSLKYQCAMCMLCTIAYKVESDISFHIKLFQEFFWKYVHYMAKSQGTPLTNY